MGIYHLLVLLFPIALWNTAFLFILVRSLSDGNLARTLEKAIVPVVFIGVVSGIAAYALGLLVWPYSALTASPLGRNHMSMATWTLAYWTVLCVLFWRLGEALWVGANRWIALVLAGVGVAVLAITGTLGGSLSGNPSAISEIVRLAGWETYTTFYVPSLTLAIMIGASVLLLVLGIWGRRIRG